MTGPGLTIDRALLVAAIDALEAAETRAGHLAQRVVWEHLGNCTPGFCAPGCVEHKALLAQLRGVLEQAP